jgi:hypothetical protein
VPFPPNTPIYHERNPGKTGLTTGRTRKQAGLVLVEVSWGEEGIHRVGNQSSFFTNEGLSVSVNSAAPKTFVAYSPLRNCAARSTTSCTRWTRHRLISCPTSSARFSNSSNLQRSGYSLQMRPAGRLRRRGPIGRVAPRSRRARLSSLVAPCDWTRGASTALRI